MCVLAACSVLPDLTVVMNREVKLTWLFFCLNDNCWDEIHFSFDGLFISCLLYSRLGFNSIPFCQLNSI